MVGFSRFYGTVKLHQMLLLLWLGSGVLGGIGLGLGYVSQHSTLMMWFPDRRGLATTIAITGLGGALVGAPLAQQLMRAFATATDIRGLADTPVLAAVYWAFMQGGAFGYRLPPRGWRPPARAPNAAVRGRPIDHPVHSATALRTRQFWLLWTVLAAACSASTLPLISSRPRS